MSNTLTESYADNLIKNANRTIFLFKKDPDEIIENYEKAA